MNEFMVGLILLAILMGCVITGAAIQKNIDHKKAIEYKCGEYDNTTGDFQWVEQ
jgi:hypothetical protein